MTVMGKVKNGLMKNLIKTYSELNIKYNMSKILGMSRYEMANEIKRLKAESQRINTKIMITEQKVLREITSFYNLFNREIQTQELYNKLGIFSRRDKIKVLSCVERLHIAKKITIELTGHYKPVSPSHKNVSKRNKK